MCKCVERGVTGLKERGERRDTMESAPLFGKRAIIWKVRHNLSFHLLVPALFHYDMVTQPSTGRPSSLEDRRYRKEHGKF